MTALNRHGYGDLLRGDLEWLMKQPRSLERDHIEVVLRNQLAERGDEPAPEVPPRLPSVRFVDAQGRVLSQIDFGADGRPFLAP